VGINRLSWPRPRKYHVCSTSEKGLDNGEREVLGPLQKVAVTVELADCGAHQLPQLRIACAEHFADGYHAGKYDAA